jgi:hypothetical protein
MINNQQEEALTWEESFHPQDVQELRTSEVCSMILS